MAKVIGPDEHVFIAGMNGSGKTWLARKYLATYENVIALDTKGTLKWPEVAEKEQTLITRIADLPEVKTPKIIYRPRFEELEPEYYDAFYKFCYFRRNTIVWTDEVMGVCDNALSYPRYLKAILTRGRELNVAAWTLTQRPAQIPLVVMSEARHFFCFELQMQEDRDRIARVTGVDCLKQKLSSTNEARRISEKERRFLFWYHRSGSDFATVNILVEKGKGGGTDKAV